MFRRKGSLLAVKWRDQRDVYMLSCKNPATMIDMTRGEGDHQNRHQSVKPACVVSYNANKAGVDKHDQMVQYYPLGRKTVKWWKKVFFHIFMMGLSNTHKLYNIKSTKKMSFVDYITNITKHLATKGAAGAPTIDEGAGAGPPPPPPPRPRAEIVGMFCKDPFPMKIPSNATKQKPTRKCVVCSQKFVDGVKVRKESSWQCRDCKTALCVECFFPFYRPHSRNL